MKRELAKGEVKLHDSGCELDVFTFCLYHGEFSSVSDGSDQNGKPKTYGKDGVSIAGWEAACKKAATMMYHVGVRFFERTCEGGQAAQMREERRCADQV